MEPIYMFSFLGVNSYLDIRKGRISLRLAAAYGILGILRAFLDRRLMLLLVGMIPGLLLLCIGKISGGALGMGDGIIVLVSGSYMGIWEMVEFVALAFFLAAAWAAFLLAGKKKKGKAGFPFVPFLLAAYVALWLIRAVEG